VWNITPQSGVILTLEDGSNQSFKIPKNQKFNVDGKMVDAWGLKKGMKVSATKVVESPVNVVAQTKHVAGELPPLPPPPRICRFWSSSFDNQRRKSLRLLQNLHRSSCPRLGVCYRWLDC
jgi:hypothetical protein